MRRACAEGATLIELVIVLTLVAVIGAIAVPMLPDTALDRARLPGEPAILERAQRAALAEAADVIVAFNPVTGEYRISTVDVEVSIEQGPYEPDADAGRSISRWAVSRFGAVVSLDTEPGASRNVSRLIVPGVDR